MDDSACTSVFCPLLCLLSILRRAVCRLSIVCLLATWQRSQYQPISAAACYWSFWLRSRLSRAIRHIAAMCFVEPSGRAYFFMPRALRGRSSGGGRRAAPGVPGEVGGESARAQRVGAARSAAAHRQAQAAQFPASLRVRPQTQHNAKHGPFRGVRLHSYEATFCYLNASCFLASAAPLMYCRAAERCFDANYVHSLCVKKLIRCISWEARCQNFPPYWYQS